MKNRKRSAWIQAFEEVNNFMELNLDKWKHIEEIRRSYDDFISNLKKIRDIKPELEKDLSPVKSELQGKRDILVQK